MMLGLRTNRDPTYDAATKATTAMVSIVFELAPLRLRWLSYRGWSERQSSTERWPAGFCTPRASIDVLQAGREGRELRSNNVGHGQCQRDQSDLQRDKLWVRRSGKRLKREHRPALDHGIKMSVAHSLQLGRAVTASERRQRRLFRLLFPVT